jgi:hypothetical protein
MRWLPWLCCAVLCACTTDWGNAEERFTRAYAEILVVRQTVADSAQAAAQVEQILHRYGYPDEPAFRRQFLEFARRDPALLRRIFDSASARAELLLDSLRRQ